MVSLAEACKRLLAAQMELETGLNPAAEKQDRKRAEKAEAVTFKKTALAFLESRRENGIVIGILSPLSSDERKLLVNFLMEAGRLFRQRGNSNAKIHRRRF